MKEVAVFDSRLKQMLINDKKENPNKLVGIIKSEIFYILKNYMDIKSDDIIFDIGIDNNGKYLLSLSAEVSRIYVANYLVWA